MSVRGTHTNKNVAHFSSQPGLLTLYCLSTPFQNSYFYATFMDSLVVNDTCEYTIPNLKSHFVHGEVIKMHTIHESNCKVMKQTRSGNSTAKKLTKKSNSIFRSYQAHVMGWMHLILFTQDRSSNRSLIQDNAGRRTFSTFFKKDQFLDLMIVNFENTTSHKYLVKKLKS